MNARRVSLQVACAFVLLSAAIPCPAQDQQEKKDEPPHWGGDVSLGLSLARGNTNSSNFSFTFSAAGPRGKDLMWENTGRFVFGEVNEKTNAESGQIDSELDWHHTKRYFSYIALQALHDRFKNFNYRITPGVGVGYMFVDQEALNLTLEAGFGWVFAEYYETRRRVNSPGLKGGQSFVWKISKTAEFNERAEFVAGLSVVRRYFLRVETNLVTVITSSWAAKLTFIDSYDSRPVGLGIKQNDLVVTAGISRRF